MSYRSDVYIRIELPKSVETLDQANRALKRIETNYLTPVEVSLDDVFSEYKVEEEHMYEDTYFSISLMALDTKWYIYNDGSGVKEFTDFLEDFKKEIQRLQKEEEDWYEEDCGGYHFVRIGEQIEDIEEDYRGSLHRTLEVIRKVKMF